MSEYLYTEAQVREMWKRTYEEQIGVAQAKAIEARNMLHSWRKTVRTK